MALTEERLRSPQILTLKPILTAIDQMINDGADVELSEPQAVAVRDALEWIIVSLDNRKAYHKKRNYQMREEMRLMDEALRGKGFDVTAIKRAASNTVADKLTDESES